LAVAIQPMLASLTDAPLDDPHFVYEPKYDGIRAVAEIGDGVRLWSRLGNDKAAQFPEIARALEGWAKKRKATVVLDGEIVALDEKGEPTGFQALQGRIHLSDPSRPVRHSRAARPTGRSGAASTAFIAFDLLQDGKTNLRERPLTERRSALEKIFSKTGNPILRLSRQVRGDGRALYDEAFKQGWEGLIAKHAASLYKPGKRTPDWRKVKISHEQEFVIGGWTEPRQSRSYFGALLLGVYASSEKRAARDENCLTYVGHTGTGFNEQELARLIRLMKPLETRQSPFCEAIKTNEHAHWVKPDLVAQIKFTEWTADARLRHPVYLGLRDDKKPTDVTREDVRVRGSGLRVQGSPGFQGSPGSQGSQSSQSSQTPRASETSLNSRRARRAPRSKPSEVATGNLVEQLSELEKARRDGVLTLPDGDALKVTNLAKLFWPKLKLTKGDLFRYYARVAPFLLPVLNDRPLVMKRFPNGIEAQPFYQHRAPDYPPGIRVETVKVAETRQHIIGGTLKALLYTTQLAAISQDPWFSRVQHPQFADHAALDLDPADGVPFKSVLDVARWIRDELDALGAKGWPKTSGSDGLHIYVPLPAGTPYDAGMIFCQIVATVVSQKHPRVATVERAVAARGKRVYVDFLQNILGKTLASAYSARASDYAGVSTPLSWKEVDAGVDRREFTITSMPARLANVGDLWKALLTAKGFDLERVTRYIKSAKR
jgi:bifunctional non-homologous end joining protein LigD